MRAVTAALLAITGLSSACVQLRRLSLSEALVASARPLCHVRDVRSSSSCAQLCAREPQCAAIRYNHGVASCHLLTARFDLLEGARALEEARGSVEVLAIQGRGFGECPSSYTGVWRSSRYRWVREAKTWETAVKVCEAEGGKLAELTSEAEMQAAFNSLGIGGGGISGFIHVGGLQAAGAEEKRGGWYFLRSRLPVNMSLFHRNEPNNVGNQENHLSATQVFGKVYYNDYDGRRHTEFICECVRFE